MSEGPVDRRPRGEESRRRLLLVVYLPKSLPFAHSLHVVNLKLLPLLSGVQVSDPSIRETEVET